jgi:hypothetical protein
LDERTGATCCVAAAPARAGGLFALAFDAAGLAAAFTARFFGFAAEATRGACSIRAFTPLLLPARDRPVFVLMP